MKHQSDRLQLSDSSPPGLWSKYITRMSLLMTSFWHTGGTHVRLYPCQLSLLLNKRTLPPTREASNRCLFMSKYSNTEMKKSNASCFCHSPNGEKFALPTDSNITEGNGWPRQRGPVVESLEAFMFDPDNELCAAATGGARRRRRAVLGYASLTGFFSSDLLQAISSQPSA